MAVRTINIKDEVLAIIRKEPVEESVKRYILTHIKFPKYYGTTLLILELKSGTSPITYEDKYFERQGNNANEIKGISGIKAIESRFDKV